jgi:hypothetical protein
MTKKTYSIIAYYKDFFFYEVEAAAVQRKPRKLLWLTKKDWEKARRNLA